MKSLIQAVAIALTLAAPTLSFAQVDRPLTRAQVRAELRELKQAGYDPSDYFYPESLRSAQAIVDSRHDAAQGDVSGYGRDGTVKSESGSMHALSRTSEYSPLNAKRK
ncbi:DUF4148 domain-containing protein [Burkholderia guangdongensis]|uniref:DUF4148 domain-containing protein n=1 Tax=Burkholderia guangdongensis TaxID=1792500 RepID=UPI0015CA7C89|nr:DUF4148 domain-containing protein [Burkholderia guangdongensis]